MKRWRFGLATSLLAAAVAADGVDHGRARELDRLLTHDCGSCHGLRLTGGLGPPLTPEALEGYTADFVAAVILRGRGGTAMPPWRGLLTEEEARWLAENLLSGAKR